MFEHEIMFYCARGAVLADGHDSVPLSDITSSALLPDPIKTHFAAESRWLLREAERTALSRFDRSVPAARELFPRLESALAPTAVFSRDEYLELLERAVKLTFNYLCRPQLTLRSFVFRGAGSVLIEDALLRVPYFFDYPYFRAVLTPWLERKQARGEESLTSDVFARTLAKIDDQIMQAMTVRDLHATLQPLYAWIANAQPAPTETIATDAFVVFFDDKNIIRIAEHLSSLAQHTPALSTHQVCIIIEELIRQTEGDADPESPETVTTTEPPAESRTFARSADAIDSDVFDREPLASAETFRPSATSEPVSSLQDAPIPPESIARDVNVMSPVDPNEDPDVVMASNDIVTEDSVPAGPSDNPSATVQPDVFSAGDARESAAVHAVMPVQELTIEPSAPVSVPDAAPAPAFQPPPVPMATKQATLGAMLGATRFGDRSSEFKIVGSRSSAPQLVDLRSLIDDEARRKFIRKLFRKNDPEYERALEALNELQTWKDASAFVDSLFLKFGVDPYAKTAIQFTDVVYSRFVKAPAGDRS